MSKVFLCKEMTEAFPEFELACEIIVVADEAHDIDSVWSKKFDPQDLDEDEDGITARFGDMQNSGDSKVYIYSYREITDLIEQDVLMKYLPVLR